MDSPSADDDNKPIPTNAATAIRVLLTQFEGPGRSLDSNQVLPTPKIWTANLHWVEQDAGIRLASLVHSIVLPTTVTARIQAGYDLSDAEQLALDTAKELLFKSTSRLDHGDRTTLNAILSKAGALAVVESRIDKVYKPIQLRFLDEIDEFVEDWRLSLVPLKESQLGRAILPSLLRALDDVRVSTLISRRYRVIVGLDVTLSNVVSASTAAAARSGAVADANEEAREILDRIKTLLISFQFLTVIAGWAGIGGELVSISAASTLVATLAERSDKVTSALGRIVQALGEKPQEIE